MKKEIENKNDNGEYHGYQEQYNSANYLRVRCMAKNGNPLGYTEWNISKKTVFYIR